MKKIVYLLAAALSFASNVAYARGGGCRGSGSYSTRSGICGGVHVNVNPYTGKKATKKATH